MKQGPQRLLGSIATMTLARALVLFVAGLCAGASPGFARPNIVFILADDLGWRDLRCYGSEWHDTPNLDRLAREGTRFTHGYAAAPICSASRVALLTGRSPARLGFEFVTKEPNAKPPDRHALTPPPYPLNLPLEEITLAEVLGPAGYTTGYFGKWHVSQHTGGYLGWSATHGPLQQGFVEGEQEFGSHPYGDAALSPKARTAKLPAGDYGRDALTEKAVAFLRAHRSDAKPFYLHLAHYYVHTPIRSRAAWLVEKYAARLPAGTDLRRAVYGAMVETLDHLVGDLLRVLDELGLAHNTLVVFTSDNGGHPEFAANGPLRGSKWNVYEGGLRVPWIVRWPGHVPAGATSDVPFIGTDLLPTLAAAAGASLPRGVTLDGRNVLPLWTGTKPTAAEAGRAFVWHFPYYHPETGYAQALAKIGVNDFAVSQTRPQSTLHAGDWKLVHFYEDDRDELYRLSADASEQTDLAVREPAVARDLRRRLDEELRIQGARFPTVTTGFP
ncbi:MAG: sulfatase [Opitutaceae bacterium]|nr:sulfatase [Opitutaceae bacterium]